MTLAVVLLIIALLIHILAVVLWYFLIKLDIVKISAQLLVLEIFVPVWGFIMLIYASYSSFKMTNGTKDRDVDDLTIDENSYMSVKMGEQNNLDDIVPIEEVLLVNDTTKKRDVLMDAIQQDNPDYLPFLEKARLDDNIDVAHFGSTAVMEFQRKYQLAITRGETLLSQDGDNPEYLDRTIDAIVDYIESNLFQSVDISRRKGRLAELLMHRINLPETAPKHYLLLVQIQIENKNYIVAERYLDNALTEWPLNEDLWKLKIGLGKEKDDINYILNTISDMKKSGIYLSNDLREIITFWTGESF